MPSMTEESLNINDTESASSSRHDEETDDSSKIATEGKAAETRGRRWMKKILSFYQTNSFLILIVIALVLAYAYPPLGAVYLAPQITASWIAVIIIFTLSGLGLPTEAYKHAVKEVPFNIFVEVFNFLGVSGFVYGLSKGLLKVNGLSQQLADGLVITSCLPITVSMIMALVVAASGDEASAVFHSAISNFLGVFITPALVVLYLNSEGEIDIGTILSKLVCVVIVPIIIGQLLRNFVPPVRPFSVKYKRHFSRINEWALVFIVYTVFCKTFLNRVYTPAKQIMIMIGVICFSIVVVMAVTWVLVSFLFPNKPQLQVVAIYGCHHKTIAMGIPLISAIYEGSPYVGVYTLPIIVWYPMQLFVGLLSVHHVKRYVDRRMALLTVDEEVGIKTVPTSPTGTISSNEATEM